MRMREKLERALLSGALFDHVSEAHLAPIIEETIDAVLAALREPDEGMKRAGKSVQDDEDYTPVSCIYRAMIDDVGATP